MAMSFFEKIEQKRKEVISSHNERGIGTFKGLADMLKRRKEKSFHNLKTTKKKVKSNAK